MGEFQHAVESDMLCSSTNPSKVPYFNAPIYLQNKNQIGKVDEILGPLNEVYFTIKMNEGMIATSFKRGDKVYIGGDKLLPIERFLPKPKVEGAKGKLKYAKTFKTLPLTFYKKLLKEVVVRQEVVEEADAEVRQEVEVVEEVRLEAEVEEVAHLEEEEGFRNNIWIRCRIYRLNIWYKKFYLYNFYYFSLFI